ncbi:hypothetical protein OKA05_27020 [Luteolibacter arcticus]|uniref:Uncharacterized protein n=1 Tax=Luteolibacter arcticus TaxID=1581411 RepID=A0ABT3GRT5_9BACT|nr:hypothetical protein [Luteolibacter arcticus]MCW1926239.1 hypothetical protein [Luteolibacter arcticus]
MKPSIPAIPLLLAILSFSAAAVAETTAVVGHVPKLEEEAEIQASFKELGPLVGALKEDSKLTLYEGLPHQSFERDLLASERKDKKTITRYSFSFYDQPNPVSEEDAKRLKSLVQDPKSFAQWQGVKRCGGFHPDFALVWKDSDAELEIHVCFGCHEIMAYRNKVEVYCEIEDEALSALKKILGNYQKQRPKR